LFDFFLRVIDFQKINGRIKNFEKYTSGAKPHAAGPAAMPHGVEGI
jgi:hypothetical protein